MPTHLPIVVLPGNMCDARAYEPQFDAFAGREIYFADLTQDKTIRGMAKRTLDSAPRRFIAFGHSMGGITCLELLRQAPNRILGAILMATNPAKETAEGRARRHALLETLERTSIRQLVREGLAPHYFAHCNEEWSELVADMAEDIGERAFRSQAQALMHRPDSIASLSAIRVPTLLVCGEDDELVSTVPNVMMSKMLQQAQLEIIRRAGHFPGLEQPHAVNRVIRSWLTSRP